MVWLYFCESKKGKQQNKTEVVYSIPIESYRETDNTNQ